MDGIERAQAGWIQRGGAGGDASIERKDVEPLDTLVTVARHRPPHGDGRETSTVTRMLDVSGPAS